MKDTSLLHAMDSHVFAFLLILLFKSASSFTCPRGCNCLSDDENQLKLNCKWTHIATSLWSLNSTTGLAVRDDQFPMVTSLTIRCLSHEHESDLESPLFGKFPNLRNLDVRGCNSLQPKLTSKFLSGLNQLRALNLQRIHPKQDQLTFDIGAMNGLSRLEKLSIKQSHLRSFPMKLLCGLPELKMLDLSENDITDLSALGEYSRKCSSQLILLNLTSNIIGPVKSSDFGMLPALMVLGLSQNRISSIEKQTFASLSNLKEVYLASNNLTTVEHMPDTVSLLDLSHNAISEFPKSLSSMKKLRVLLLTGNLIETVDETLTAENNTLERLNLRNNRIVSISETAFVNLTELTHLDVCNNRLDALQPGTFRNLQELNVLNLANNRLRGLNGSHFEGLTNVGTLDLGNNTLISLATDVFSELTNLKSMSVRDNLLNDIPSSVSSVYHLIELDLSINQISAIRKGLFTKLPNLERLNISNNRLTTIERYTFEDMSRLNSLDLSSNAIAQLSPGCFSRCVNLASVRLDDNRLAAVDGVFAGRLLPSLSLLNLTANQLTVLPLADLAASLNVLLVAGNRLRSLSGSAAHLTALDVIDLGQNQLARLAPDHVAPRLRFAIFYNNTIAEVEPATFVHCDRLESVDLRFNRLVTLRSNAFRHGLIEGDGTKVSIYGNHLDCHCDIEWMRKHTRAPDDQSTQIADIDRVKCRNILTDERDLIKETKPEEFLCQYDSVCLARCPCCRFPGCGCNNVCPSGCSCYRDLSDNVNIVKCTGVEVDTKSLPMEATSVYIDEGNMTSLRSNAFMSVYKLRKLVLNNNNIGNISAQAFNNLNNLEVLDLSHNRLSTISGDEFYRVESLKSLFLDNNQIMEVGPLDALPSLQYLKLHHNNLEDLPPSVKNGNIKSVTLAANPWRCDCDGRFDVQRWLPTHRQTVNDAAAVYCYENVTEARLQNDTTILSSLPSTDGGDLVMVNFWTFRDEINRTICRGEPYSLVSSNADVSDIERLLRQPMTPIILFVLVVTAITAVFLCLLVLVRCSYTHVVGTKALRKSPPSVNSSQSNSTPVGPLYSPAMPLLRYDAFIAYSTHERAFIENDLAPYLQRQHALHVCLLHRELRGVMDTVNHQISDELIDAMRHSESLVVCVSGHFLRDEWNRPDVCTAIKTFVRSRRPLVFLLPPDTDALQMDATLGHLMRTNLRIDCADPQMREKLAEAIPDNTYASLNGSASNHYSDMYGKTVDWV